MKFKLIAAILGLTMTLPAAIMAQNPYPDDQSQDQDQYSKPSPNVPIRTIRIRPIKTQTTNAKPIRITISLPTVATIKGLIRLTINRPTTLMVAGHLRQPTISAAIDPEMTSKAMGSPVTTKATAIVGRWILD
jgi:hypothetical protein